MLKTPENANKKKNNQKTKQKVSDRLTDRQKDSGVACTRVRAMIGGTISLTIPKLKLFKEGLVNPH